jgi:hypothetical protein
MNNELNAKIGPNTLSTSLDALSEIQSCLIK